MISDDHPRHCYFQDIARRECTHVRRRPRVSLIRPLVYSTGTGTGTSKAVSQKRRIELILALATAPAIWLGLESATTAPTEARRVAFTPPPIRHPGKAKGAAPLRPASTHEDKVSDVRPSPYPSESAVSELRNDGVRCQEGLYELYAEHVPATMHDVKEREERGD
jgi:hypothetical protein